MAQLAVKMGSPEFARESQIEGRRANRLLFYWQSLRRIEGIPAYVDFDPRRNPLPWDHSFLLYRSEDGALAFDVFGEALLKFVGKAPAALADIPEACVLDDVLAGLAFLFSRGQPWKYDGETMMGIGLVKHRSILLPFRDVRRRLAYVMAGVTFRVYPPN